MVEWAREIGGGKPVAEEQGGVPVRSRGLCESWTQAGNALSASSPP